MRRMTFAVVRVGQECFYEHRGSCVLTSCVLWLYGGTRAEIFMVLEVVWFNTLRKRCYLFVPVIIWAAEKDEV